MHHCLSTKARARLITVFEPAHCPLLTALQLWRRLGRLEAAPVTGEPMVRTVELDASVPGFRAQVGGAAAGRPLAPEECGPHPPAPASDPACCLAACSRRICLSWCMAVAAPSCATSTGWSTRTQVGRSQPGGSRHICSGCYMAGCASSSPPAAARRPPLDAAGSRQLAMPGPPLPSADASVGEWDGDQRTVSFTTPVDAPAMIKRLIGMDVIRVVETQRRAFGPDGSATLVSRVVPWRQLHVRSMSVWLVLISCLEFVLPFDYRPASRCQICPEAPSSQPWRCLPSATRLAAARVRWAGQYPCCPCCVLVQRSIARHALWRMAWYGGAFPGWREAEPAL